MSSLYKLLISGIRLFSPKDHETIQFGSPLTLICGQNGCGKTTIIESLKYATTGDLPPNSKGGAFVNDPTIADRLVVNAEIKLGFVSVDGKPMTVTRNMQLNRKRVTRGVQNSNTFKSLEGQLAVVAKGEKTSISTKNAELDTRVPLYLGALKAILEYVIFCHQDDSLWPLSEAGVLKKRFDEIFEALKFTKVLDSLKTIRKDMAADIRVIEQGVQHAQLDKSRASKVKLRLLELVQKAEQFLLEIAALTVQIERLEQRANELFHLNQAFQQTLSEYERMRLLVDLTTTAVRRLENSVTLLHEPDAQLLAMAADFGAVKLEKSHLLALVQAEIALIESSLEGLQTEFHKLVRDEGSLAAKKAGYEENLHSLENLKNRFFSGENVARMENLDLESRLREKQQTAASRLEKTVAENNKRKKSASDALQTVSEKLRKEEDRLAYGREEIASTVSKIKATKTRISALAVNEETLELEKSQLESLRVKLESRKASLDAKTRNDQIEAENAQIHRLELELEDLMRKIHSANKLSALVSKIELLQESRGAKQSVLERYMNTQNPAFSSIFGSEIDPSTAETLVETERRKRGEDHGKLHAEAGALLATANKHDSEVHAGEKSLANLKAKLQKHAKNVLSVLSETEIPEYESLVAELEEDYKTAVYNLNTFEVTKSYKLKAMEVAKISKCCALCNRGMDQQELTTFVRDIEQNVATFTAEKLTMDVETTTKDLHEMKAINVDVIEYRRVQDEIQQSEIELESLKNALDEAKKLYMNTSKLVDTARDKLDAVEALIKPMADVARMSEEVKALDRQISDISDELEELGVSSVSMNELQKSQQQKNFEIKNLRQSVTDLVQEGNARQKEMSRLEYQYKEKELLISKLQLSLGEATSLKQQIRELETREHELRAQSTEFEESIELLRSVQEQERKSLESVETQCFETERSLQKALDTAESEIREFCSVLEQLKHFEEVESALVAQNETALAQTKEKMDLLVAAKKDKEEQAREHQNFINDAASTERNIRDNLELRHTEQQLHEQQEALAEMDIANAEQEKELYQEKSREIRAEISTLNEQHYGKVGEVKQIRDQIQLLQKELATDFKDVEKHYHDEWIKLQTNLLVSTDLQTYLQALDNAIMKYHSMKMDEINRILRELWTQTYRGTDIDGIEIKCDVTNQTRGRSYNYRVVMYKKASELDMRGRCSAGQKVLTSILIRLALAECFGLNCGMIALDEPTTNLDVENAESLANALSNIIEFRKSQKNFQLIVITHDEKFLNHINGGRFVDNFYRIERDENQHSIIKSLPIHVMQGE
ncbi:DNA repair protein RAD50 [Metschnikowia aff. pulcherrima]|uniref:DNA repair protein RAD50 n=1 Tax=Metschnikowia aff. pulcherrima TaxID=2163413 RepID=A0A4P6XM62_9ASCO|nr:DNA repair protein RAD50 [Metschnikowia aff. pulcherrima]